jgi:hypothetical protein
MIMIIRQETERKRTKRRMLINTRREAATKDVNIKQPYTLLTLPSSTLPVVFLFGSLGAFKYFRAPSGMYVHRPWLLGLA